MNVKTQIAKINLPEGGFRLECGRILPELVVAYETYGKLNDNRDNVIFICHALSGDAHVAGVHEDGSVGWWDEMVGPGKPLDTNLYFVVCANILGGCKGTTGPSSVNPATGKPYGSSFPRITVGDIIEVHLELLKHLGIEKIAALVGGSFGGMQVLEWVVKHPDTVNRGICVASATSLSAQALAFDVVGRKVITSDPDWRSGDYYDEGVQPERGLAQARMIGHITYLSQEMMSQKFGRERKGGEAGAGQAADTFSTDFQVESYLDHQGDKFTDRFDANSYLHITRAMDEFDLGSRYGSLEKAFEAIKAKVLIVALSEDWLFPPSQSKEIANGLLKAGKNVSYCELIAPHGHDAFLVDICNMGDVMKAFLPWVSGTGNDQAREDRIQGRAVDSGKARDFFAVARMINKGARVLDLGCGDGALLQYLADTVEARGVGVDLDLEHVISVIDRGLDIYQSDIDEGLAAIPDDSYDCVVLNDTLQVVQKPRKALNEALRIARECIITFPNFGNWSHRLRLLLGGRMPKSGSLPFEWYNTPNIHLFTLRDFVELCSCDGIRVVDVDCHYCCSVGKLLGLLGLRNAGADRVTIKIARGGERAALR